MNIALTSLHKRVLSGLGFGVVVWAGAFALPSVFACAVLLLFAVVGLHEFYRLSADMEMPAFRGLGIAGGALLMLSGIARAYRAYEPVMPATWRTVVEESGLLVIFLLLLVICARSFFDHENRHSVITVAVTMLGVLYVPFLLGFLLRLLFSWDPPAPLEIMSDTGCALGLFLLLVVKSGDMGAFFIGRRWGRHQLCPHLSPKKTWEGFVAGLFASTASALGVMAFLPAAPGGAWFGTLVVHWHDAVILGLLLSGVGVLGDLVESQLKRAAGAKDSGALIPGMGGLLDVLDSLLFAAPALYFYVIWFIE